MDRRYLMKRRQTWYVRVRVPPSLQEAVGTDHILKSLQTRDYVEACLRRHAVVAEIKARLDSLRNAQRGPVELSSVQELHSQSKEIRQQLEVGAMDPETAGDAWSAALDFHLKQYPVDDTGRPDADEQTVKAIRDMGRVALDPMIYTLDMAAESHLAEAAQRVRKQTLNARRRRIEAFRSWLDHDADLRDITREQAGRYVTDVLTRQGRAPKTTQDTLSDLSAFFQWCVDRGRADTNPFAGLSRTVRGTQRGTREKAQSKRREWTRAELQTLLSSVDRSHPIWVMSVLALYTGMRVNEIAETRIEDVHSTHIHVPEGKTESSVRDVPLHPVIRPLVASLKAEAAEVAAKAKKGQDTGYLVPNLNRGGEDNKRSHCFSKAFGYHVRRKLGIADTGLVFHSLRKNFSRALEEAGVSENLAQQIVGHKKQSMTYGLYSQGVSLKALQEAVDKVSYGEIDCLLNGTPLMFSV